MAKSKRPFCDSGCKECYQIDRGLGLIYGSWLVDEKDVSEGMQTWDYAEPGKVLVGWEDGSKINGTCAYCGAELKGGKA